MELRIGYEEASGLIAKAVNQEVALKRVADDEVGVAAKVKMLFVSKWVNINLKIERIDGTDVVCSYSGGFGVGALIKGALTFLKGYFPEVVEMIDLNDDDRLVLHLNEVKQFKSALEILALQRISFSSDAINVNANFK